MNDKKRSGGCVMSMVKMFIFGIFLVIIITAIVSKTQSTQSTPASPKEVAERAEQENLKNAYYAAKGYIKQNLKSPSTAKWSNFYSDENSGTGHLKDVTNGFYAVGYVDAQNTFGAMLRQNWRVDMIKDGEMWRFFHATLGDQVLLDIKLPGAD